MDNNDKQEYKKNLELQEKSSKEINKITNNMMNIAEIKSLEIDKITKNMINIEEINSLNNFNDMIKSLNIPKEINNSLNNLNNIKDMINSNLNKIELNKELVSNLNICSYYYYQMQNPLIPDIEYDERYNFLETLEQITNTVFSTSPTQKVGYEVVSNLNKVSHASPMLSLNKTKEYVDLENFLIDKNCILSSKLDGLTVVLTYKNGKLQSATTRGNGLIGEDITHNAHVFKNIPIKIDFEDELIIRGEAVISFENFKNINDKLELEKQYKNPRNLASGSVRQLNNEITSDRHIDFIAFSCSYENEFNLKSQNLNYMRSLGFETVCFEIVNLTNLKQIFEDFKNNIVDNQYATDGLVLTFDEIDYSKSLGTTSKFPKDSIAFKWKDELVQTILIGIEWNTSRTGLVNPVAIFEPVEIEGTIVSKASLHNLSIVNNLQLGIGDTIEVYKANMIIPQIYENITKSGTIEIPTKCNVCLGQLEVVQLKDTTSLVCTNSSCGAKIIKSIIHFVSRECMNIDGLSEATIKKFIDEGYIKNYVDIFKIEKYKQEIINKKGFGEKSYNKLISSIEKCKIVNLENFINALGIDNVGLSNAKLLCKTYNYDINKIKNCKAEDFIEIHGFGDVIAISLEDYFKNEKNLKILNELLEILFIKKVEISQNSKLFENVTFVITGKIESFKNRNELKKTLEDLGAKVTNTVTSSTNYLINNDKNSSSSKNKKANELNIKIINEEELQKLIG